MSMIIKPENPASESAADGAEIRAGVFWPSIKPAEAREEMRLDGNVTPARLRSALIEAMASVNSELAEWRQARIAAGFTALDQVPAEDIDGKSVLLHRWRRAVLCEAAAILTERYRSFDTTGTGHQRADQLDPSIDELRRDKRWAISDMQGVGRCAVELI